MATPISTETRWELGALRTRLADPLSAAFPQHGPLRLDLLCKPKAVADDVTKLVAVDPRGIRLAVILVAARYGPDLVRQGIEHADQIRSVLDTQLSTAIIKPLSIGTLDDRTYAVLPYCKPISTGRIAKRVHRRMVRPVILDWLARVAESTARVPDEQQTRDGFITPLGQLAANEVMGPPIRYAAESALNRLHSGEWEPRHIVSHGDMWDGNILFSNKDARDPTNPFSRIVIIDWPGAMTDGYAMYDLTRLSRSMQLPKRILRAQILRHCRALGCDPAGARDHLVAAIAHLGTRLGHFPPDRYAQMASECLYSLDHTLNPRSA